MLKYRYNISLLFFGRQWKSSLSPLEFVTTPQNANPLRVVGFIRDLCGKINLLCYAIPRSFIYRSHSIRCDATFLSMLDPCNWTRLNLWAERQNRLCVSTATATQHSTSTSTTNELDALIYHLKYKVKIMVKKTILVMILHTLFFAEPFPTITHSNVTIVWDTHRRRKKNDFAAKHFRFIKRHRTCVDDWYTERASTST